MNEFEEPDQLTLELLGAEHQNGTWVGEELLPIASRIRNRGGSEDDYLRWVRSSHLWTSYVNSTSDRVTAQRKHLHSAWGRAERSKPFDLEESLTDLGGRIATYTGWVNTRTASRNRVVALALVEFCFEHNCFTRTISSYELAKWTAGLSPMSVSRGLGALVSEGLIREVERTDRRTSTRSTKRYQLNLRWQLGAAPQHPPKGVSTPDAMNTGIASLPHELPPPHDLWSRKGLGPGAQRVWELLTDEPVTVRHIAERTGMKGPSIKRYLKMLAEHALAGVKAGARGAPSLYFRVDTPLDAVADAMGIYGHVEIKRWEIEQRQNLNRAAYPGSYRRPKDEPTEEVITERPAAEVDPWSYDPRADLSSSTWNEYVPAWEQSEPTVWPDPV